MNRLMSDPYEKMSVRLSSKIQTTQFVVERRVGTLVESATRIVECFFHPITWNYGLITKAIPSETGHPEKKTNFPLCDRYRKRCKSDSGTLITAGT